MTKDSAGDKSTGKKLNILSNMELENHFKNQQNIICQHRTQLQDAISKWQLLDSELEEKNNLILKLEEW